jgi:hypothetical protein
MSWDNDTDLDYGLDLTNKTIKILRKKYLEALENKRNWIDFQDRRLSRNFVTYVLAYYAEP